jgi:hypothetical protein
VTVVRAERRRRPPRRRARRLVVVMLIALAFVFGIALGEALHDNPRPGGEQTLVRTLAPVPLSPVSTGRGGRP